MGISGVSSAVGYQSQAAVRWGSSGQETEGERLAAALREERESQPTLTEMMKEAKEPGRSRRRLGLCQAADRPASGRQEQRQ